MKLTTPLEAELFGISLLQKQRFSIPAGCFTAIFAVGGEG